MKCYCQSNWANKVKTKTSQVIWKDVFLSVRRRNEGWTETPTHSHPMTSHNDDPSLSESDTFSPPRVGPMHTAPCDAAGFPITPILEQSHRYDTCLMMSTSIVNSPCCGRNKGSSYLIFYWTGLCSTWQLIDLQPYVSRGRRECLTGNKTANSNSYIS